MEYLTIEFGRVGAETHLTPREVIRDFIELLDIMCQNPTTDLQELMASGTVGVADASAPSNTTPFAEFTI